MSQLLEEILSRDNMMRAYKRVVANKGASGVDGITTEEVKQYLIEICEDIRCTRGMKEIYSRRKETIERDFGTAKEHHAMRYTQQVGKEKMAMKVGLTFACMNMKKLANMLWNYRRNEPKNPVDPSTRGAMSASLHDFLSILRNILKFSEYIPVYDSI